MHTSTRAPSKPNTTLTPLGTGKEPDIYRIVPMTNEGHREVDVQGITTYRFVTEVSFRHTLSLCSSCWTADELLAQPGFYLNCDNNPSNCKYFMFGPDGFLNLSVRALGVPFLTGQVRPSSTGLV
jgi:hypothetical protein